MSAVEFFLEIDKLRRKIDESMQMEIWSLLFPLFSDDNNRNIQLSTTTFVDFLTTVARLSQNSFRNNNAALASQYAAGSVAPSAPRISANTTFRPVLFTQTPADSSAQRPETVSIDMRRYRNSARKLVQHYTLNTTNSTEYKIRDVVMTMIFLIRSEKYHYIFKLLETTFDDYTCRPQMSQIESDTIIDAIRSLLEMPSIDLNTIDVMRSSFSRCFHSPVMRYAKIMLLQNPSLQQDKRTTIEQLLVERGQNIQMLQPQQYILSGTEIPFCEDAEFLDLLLKHIDPFPLRRMFYNAANTMFYTTMENYAISNCKFNIEDYNNIFRVMDKIRKLNKKHESSDDLNFYLGSTSTAVKRKKY
ncbi:P40 [Parapoynx stagnalis nucleopolyhedrovirus]|uniref:P40 n=1 Tax=Parapoynx stagnalis nucleopolyhedrovirus TaxID=2993413 RepID=A0A9E7YDT8_9ABAC|nr:P40 [Parapoynx stagnalis nucleopolyhedrovirus]